jgi:hypothetical protein
MSRSKPQIGSRFPYCVPTSRLKRSSSAEKVVAALTRALSPPPSLWPPTRALSTGASRRFFRMTLTTPAIASEPYSDDWPSGRISMRSTRSIGMPLMLLNVSLPLYSAG